MTGVNIKPILSKVTPAYHCQIILQGCVIQDNALIKHRFMGCLHWQWGGWI